MVRYVLGLDGGGSKTELAAAVGRQELFRLQGGAINLNGARREVVKENLQTLLREAMRRAGGEGECDAVCVGSAGVSNPAVAPALEEMVREVFPGAPVRVVGDHEIALAGALEGNAGMVLISGTGTFCFGRTERGETARTGGYGHLIDDRGGGYSIGQEILRAVVLAQDGRGPATALSELVFGEPGIPDVRSLVAHVYAPGNGKDVIARFSSLLPRAVAVGDSVALEIVDDAAKALAQMVFPVAERLCMQSGRLALVGSVLKNDVAVRSALEKELARQLPLLACVRPLHDAVTGAVLLAQELQNDTTP